MKLSIIIVNYNVKHFLEHCLHAVMRAISGIQTEIIVVDNNSSDESTSYLKAKFPPVIFIENKGNTGFAKANNQGLAIAKGEYILYLNPDTLIAENTLINCIYFLDEHQSTSAVGVQMLDGSGTFLPESKRSFPTPATSFYKLFLMEKLFPKSKIFGKYALGFLDKNKVHEVDVLAGAFIMSRTSLLLQINGFDERYFMYGEDIDLSYSLQQTGHQNFYLGNTTIIHFKGESTKKGNIKYVKVFYKAMILFVEKYYKGSTGFIYTNLLKLGIISRSALSAIKQPFVREKKSIIDFEKIFLVGDNIATERAKTICTKYFPKAILALTHNMEQKKLNSKNDAIIFCITERFSYLQAINFLQQNSPVENVFWFHENADSIIGSSNKKSSGEVFI